MLIISLGIPCYIQVGYLYFISGDIEVFANFREISYIEYYFLNTIHCMDETTIVKK